MKTNLDIRVQIGGRPYMLSVPVDDERVVRLAADNVNQLVKEFAKSFEYKDQQDLFAMIALQHAATAIRLEEEKSFREEEMEKRLIAIDELVSVHINQN